MLSLLFQITCEALNAHPAPQLNWVEPQDAEVDVSAQPQINTYDITTDIRHSIKYKAQLKDDGGKITCIGTQVKSKSIFCITVRKIDFKSFSSLEGNIYFFILG